MFIAFISVYERKDLGGAFVKNLKASTLEEAKAEALAYIAEEYPEDDRDRQCGFAAVVEVSNPPTTIREVY